MHSMGRILTIRVSAVTFDQSEVFRAWPRLCALSWPGQGEVEDGEWKRIVLPPAIGPSLGAEKPRFGVLELAAALADQARFGDWLSGKKELLRDGLGRLAKAGEDLEAALSDWKPSDAHKASNAMEDALDDMEKLLR